jgi:hypothetical protein
MSEWWLAIRAAWRLARGWDVLEVLTWVEAEQTRRGR